MRATSLCSSSINTHHARAQHALAIQGDRVATRARHRRRVAGQPQHCPREVGGGWLPANDATRHGILRGDWALRRSHKLAIALDAHPFHVCDAPIVLEGLLLPLHDEEALLGHRHRHIQLGLAIQHLACGSVEAHAEATKLRHEAEVVPQLYPSGNGNGCWHEERRGGPSSSWSCRAARRRAVGIFL